MTEKNPLVKWIFEKTGGLGIREYQLKKLKEVLRYTNTNSTFYKKHFQNIDIESLTGFDKFEKLPFTTEKDLSEQGTKMLCVPQNEIERIVTLQTSGTAGEPKRVYFTAEDQELTVDFFNTGMRCLISKKDNFMILLPYKTPGSVGDLLRLGLERLGCGVFPYGQIDCYGDACEFIKKNAITSLVGNPVQVLKLAEAAKINGVEIKLNNILLSTDYVPDVIVNRLEKLWGCNVFEHYGMTEMCFGGGVFCKFLTGYHMREADLYFEIISENGQRLPDGEYGEVVFTTLTRTGMPLIRYRTGDYGRFLPERCACSPDLKLMEKIKRRVDGGVSIGNNTFYIGDFDEMIFSCEKVVDYILEIINGKINIEITTGNDIINGRDSEKELKKRTIKTGGKHGYGAKDKRNRVGMPETDH